MTPNIRLLVCAVIIVASAVYALLVARDPGLAAAVSSGYVALLATGFVLTNFWKRP